VANAQVGYRFEHLRVFASVTNLFDSVEPVLLEPGATPADDLATVLQPRTATVGVEFTY
jgi:outer membrane receptor protein involved in Fe transport